MAREAIIEKLNRFSIDHSPVTEECQVVYFMVQLRKILEHENHHSLTGKFTYLHFFCDWIVHTKKTRITDSMREVMEKIFSDVKAQIENPMGIKGQGERIEVMKFAYMERLYDEMILFLEGHGISLKIIEDDWLAFVDHLIKVLESQPILKPTNDITSFTFLPAASGCVRGQINFEEKIEGYDHFRFGNAY